ncbi:MAG TPA: FAD-dependent oxidoreductase [Aromatoleum sp.]|uniref:NAD(P)/FAD-dependent oxidoreductase n=1 Tax=Aromatoleum sp. TaxID=2307007 RepID=UPI002B491765|nr:FAD-dependent oxidoreductase [Aromatoleum sp.]HJV27788.1 FAD-dependent oxidoreductase [Aromatoleum sp.]
MNPPIVIVGSGLAGYTFAREFRKLDRDTPLVVVSRDTADFYSKPMLSNAFSGHKTAATLVMKPAARIAEELHVDIRPHTAIAGIETATQELILADGNRIAYRDLVLGLGADPIRLPIAGDGAADILSVNDLDDFARFAERLQGVERMVVLGAGLIGCEFANDLLARNVVPTVIDIAERPLGRLLPQEAGQWMQARLEAAGIAFRMGNSATSVERAGTKYRVTLANGEVLETDLVLSAVGLRPRIELAKAAGLVTNRGIVVNRMLETTVSHIHALGDCAEVEGLVLPFVMPIMNQARALAATLAGKPTPLTYPPMPVVVKTPACPTVVCPPALNAQGSWQIAATDDGGGLEALYVGSDETSLGFALLGTATARKQGLTTRMPALLS